MMIKPSTAQVVRRTPRIQVLHIDACPNWAETVTRTRQVLDALGLADTPVVPVLIGTEDEAAAVPFAGSPTILFDGQDLFPSDGRTRDLACRVYTTELGLAGSPTQHQLKNAIRARL